MTVEEAGEAVAYLNAAFPRDALEPESFQIWVTEVASLGHAGSGLEAAKMIGRNGDRFPTIKEFRQAYRQAFDRFMAGREIEAPDDSVPPPPEAVEMLARMEAETALRSIDDLPVTESMPLNPHGAIVVLSQSPHSDPDGIWEWKPSEAMLEATRMMDES